MSRWQRRDPLNRDPANGQATALRRAQGLGSAHHGAREWWLQRATAVALVPLMLWFVASFIAHAGGDHVATPQWLGHPAVALTLIVLQVALFWHMRLGLRVIAEDYIHDDRGKFAVILLIDFACTLLALIGIFACTWLALT